MDQDVFLAVFPSEQRAKEARKVINRAGAEAEKYVPKRI